MWLQYSRKSWGLCGWGRRFVSVSLPNNILHDLWEGMWWPLGLPWVNLSLVHLKCLWPITCRHLSQSNWATWRNILGKFLGIYFFLTGLYRCLVIIPVSLVPKIFPIWQSRQKSLSFPYKLHFEWNELHWDRFAERDAVVQVSSHYENF